MWRAAEHGVHIRRLEVAQQVVATRLAAVEQQLLVAQGEAAARARAFDQQAACVLQLQTAMFQKEKALAEMKARVDFIERALHAQRAAVVGDAGGGAPPTMCVSIGDLTSLLNAVALAVASSLLPARLRRGRPPYL